MNKWTIWKGINGCMTDESRRPIYCHFNQPKVVIEVVSVCHNSHTLKTFFLKLQIKMVSYLKDVKMSALPVQCSWLHFHTLNFLPIQIIRVRSAFRLSYNHESLKDNNKKKTKQKRKLTFNNNDSNLLLAMPSWSSVTKAMVRSTSLVSGPNWEHTNDGPWV